MAEPMDSSEQSVPDLQNAKDLANYVRKHGLKELYKEVKKRLNMWKNVSLNIGVIGGSGAGKSTFINTLRRLTPTDPGAAQTNVVEGTMTPTPYDHPQNPKVKIWDLPGLGTVSFPKESYADQIQLERYDFFIIICSQRFRDDDLWCAHEVSKQQKKFYFVRTKIDDDVRHDFEDYPATHNPEEVQRRIKADCVNQLQQGNFKDPVVFLVSKNPLQYEFRALEEKLIADRQELKRDSFILTLRTASREVLAGKSAQLQRRSWLAAVACVLRKSKQVKDLSIQVNMERISKELMLYKQVLGLDNEGLDALSKSANLSIEELTNIIRQKFWFNFTEDTFAAEIEKSGGIKASEESPKLLQIPVIGFIFKCKASIDVTKKFLLTTVQNMECAAMELLNTALSNANARQW